MIGVTRGNLDTGWSGRRRHPAVVRDADRHRDVAEYWATYGVIAAAGLTMALSQILGGWTKWGWPRFSLGVFLIGFLPVLLAGGWVLLARQPADWMNTSNWSRDLGIFGAVADVGNILPAIAFGIGLVFGFSFDTAGPRREVVDEEHVPRDVPAADAPRRPTASCGRAAPAMGRVRRAADGDGRPRRPDRRDDTDRTRRKTENHTLRQGISQPGARSIGVRDGCRRRQPPQTHRFGAPARALLRARQRRPAGARQPLRRLEALIGRDSRSRLVRARCPLRASRVRPSSPRRRRRGRSRRRRRARGSAPSRSESRAPASRPRAGRRRTAHTKAWTPWSMLGMRKCIERDPNERRA